MKKDIPEKIDFQSWFAAGLVGAIPALVPWIVAQWFILEFSPSTENPQLWINMVALVFGGWGGAWTYHSLIRWSSSD